MAINAIPRAKCPLCDTVRYISYVTPRELRSKQLVSRHRQPLRSCDRDSESSASLRPISRHPRFPQQHSQWLVRCCRLPHLVILVSRQRHPVLFDRDHLHCLIPYRLDQRPKAKSREAPGTSTSLTAHPDKLERSAQTPNLALPV